MLGALHEHEAKAMRPSRTREGTHGIVDELAQTAGAMVESLDWKPDELKAVLLLLDECGEEDVDGGQNAFDPARYELDMTHACRESAKGLEKFYENPLDDQEKLNAVRRMVFGSAPE